MSTSEIFRALVCADHPGAEQWLTDAVGASTSTDLARVPHAYTAAARLTGRGTLVLSVAEAANLSAAAPGLSLREWTIFDAARALLLLSIAEAVAADVFVTAAVACYEQGDAREQQSWLKALVLLPAPERFLSYAVDACRTNILPLFESIGCGNPYPSRFFPERNFNQLVLKAMFMGLAIDRIVNLAARLNPELQRMALDFAAERKAAGRPVPGDLRLALLDGAATEAQL